MFVFMLHSMIFVLYSMCCHCHTEDEYVKKIVTQFILN